MTGGITFAPGTLFTFLLVLCRVGGALVFLPLPGFKNAPQPVRVVLAVGFTMALMPVWPAMDGSQVTGGKLAGWVAAEAAFGIAIGVAVAIVLEAFGLAAQILGLQAGYAYASTIDPTTEADSGVLLVFAQLMAGLLFFALGLDREILRLFAHSLAKVPLGVYALGLPAAEIMIRLASGLFSMGLRLALPVVALLMMVDVALALLGRLNQQLQLLALAFPAKMLTALVVLGWVAMQFPRILMESSGHAWVAVRRMLGI